MTTMFNYCMIDINIKDSIFKYKEIMKYKNKKNVWINKIHSIDSIRRFNLSIKWKKKKTNWMTSIEIENRQDKWFHT